MNMMHRSRSVDQSRFAMVPRADIPRAKYRIQKSLKTTFNSGYLIPILSEEVLPGDSFNVDMTAFARLSTPIFPVMDNLYLESFFFFIPNRLVWSNWVKFMGEQVDPTDSISFLIPQTTTPVGGYLIGSVYDYFGLPTVGQMNGAQSIEHSVLPLRGYNLVYNDWFRDENLQTHATVSMGDGPDAGPPTYSLFRRGKRHDYFTSALPWPQKGSIAVPIPAPTGYARVVSDTVIGGGGAPVLSIGIGGAPRYITGDGTNVPKWGGTAFETATASFWNPGSTGSGLVADLNNLTNQTLGTINQLRTAMQIQHYLEQNARGGTRYTELVRSIFGVVSPDARLQRSEYLGGGRNPISINPIAQTSATNADGSLGDLAAFGTSLSHGHGFNGSFTEHGYILGLVNVRADLSYQQGLRRHWSRRTRYDYYVPAFAQLGEQAILNKEIWCSGIDATDDAVFGYQERWSELRYMPSEITGLFRSTAASTLDAWHLSQRFTVLPVLSTTFIVDFPPIARIQAVDQSPVSAEFLFDAFFDIKATRPVPMFSVPMSLGRF